MTLQVRQAIAGAAPDLELFVDFIPHEGEVTPLPLVTIVSSTRAFL
jgi:hypothetical protein